jgi:hypothetical protein
VAGSQQCHCTCCVLDLQPGGRGRSKEHQSVDCIHDHEDLEHQHDEDVVRHDHPGQLDQDSDHAGHFDQDYDDVQHNHPGRLNADGERCPDGQAGRCHVDTRDSQNRHAGCRDGYAGSHADNLSYQYHVGYGYAGRADDHAREHSADTGYGDHRHPRYPGRPDRYADHVDSHGAVRLDGGNKSRGRERYADYSGGRHDHGCNRRKSNGHSLDLRRGYEHDQHIRHAEADGDTTDGRDHHTACRDDLADTQANHVNYDDTACPDDCDSHSAGTRYVRRRVGLDGHGCNCDAHDLRPDG